jgi:creatinine amidohydrolase
MAVLRFPEGDSADFSQGGIYFIGNASGDGQAADAVRPGPRNQRGLLAPAWHGERMRFGHCTYQEIAALAREGAVAVVPLGCTEQQGPHLPVDFDTWFAEAVVTAAAGQAEAEHGLPVLALPALPAGPAPEHRSFGAGYLDLPVAVHEAVVRAILDSLRAQGFQVTVVWRGCGGHDLRRLVARYNGEDHQMRVHLPEPPFPSLWSAAGGTAVPAGHADSFTTSIMLARRPELVRADRIPGPSRQPDWSDPGLDFGAYSDTGVIGDARHASSEIGQRLWQESVNWLARFIARAATVSA